MACDETCDRSLYQEKNPLTKFQAALSVKQKIPCSAGAGTGGVGAVGTVTVGAFAGAGDPVTITAILAQTLLMGMAELRHPPQ